MRCRDVLIYRRFFVRQVGLTCRSFMFIHFLFLGHFFAVGTRCALSDGKIIATILRGLGCKHKCMVPVLTNNTRIKCTAREGRSKSSGWRRSLFVQGQVANGDLSRSVNGLRGFMLQCQENLDVQLPQKRNRGFTVRGGGLPCQGHRGARLPPKGNRGFIVVTD